jgi:hypothetical protein
MSEAAKAVSGNAAGTTNAKSRPAFMGFPCH